MPDFENPGRIVYFYGIHVHKLSIHTHIHIHKHSHMDIYTHPHHSQHGSDQEWLWAAQDTLQEGTRHTSPSVRTQLPSA